MDTGHQQIEAWDGDDWVPVDEGLEYLLEWVWRHGLRTQYSCRGEWDDKGYIMFAEADDAEQFLALIGELGEEWRDRARYAAPECNAGDGWELMVFPIDDSCADWPGSTEGLFCPRMRIVVRIPSTELDQLNRQLAPVAV